jgi:putative hydrolase of the HAD superfamily
MGLLSGDMITTLFFDIGGVLLNVHPERTLQYLSDCTDISVEEIRTRFPMDAHDEYEKGNLTDREWFLAVKESLPQPCCLKESDFWRAWKLLLGDEKETVQILEDLSDNYSIWLLSNTNPKHIRDEIEKRYAFPHLVDGAVYSFDVGLRKPHEEIYLTAAKLAGTKPEDSIFIDDLEENVKAAAHIGFKVIQFYTTKQLIEDLTQLGLIQKEKVPL